MMLTLRTYVSILVVLAVVALAAGPATGGTLPIVADFTGGNDEATIVDAWHGVGGLGWKGPWQEYSRDGPLFTAVVKTAADVPPYNPLDGGGNYLDYECGSTKTGRAVIGRVYGKELYPYESDPPDPDNPLGFDLTKEHTVSWKIRIDETQADFDAKFTAGLDFYMIHDMIRVFSRDANFSGAQANWLISAWGVAGGGIPVAREWLAYNGDPDNTTWDDAHQAQTGIPLVPGVVYDMTVTNLARATLDSWGRYHLRIEATLNGTEYCPPFDSTTYDSDDPGTDPDYPDGLGWRNTAANLYGLGGAPQFSARCSNTVDVRQFSLDAVHIVPEPSTIVMGLTLALAGLGLMVRRGQ